MFETNRAAERLFFFCIKHTKIQVNKGINLLIYNEVGKIEKTCTKVGLIPQSNLYKSRFNPVQK